MDCRMYYFMYCVLLLVIQRPPRSTRTDTLFPYTTLFRSPLSHIERVVAALRLRDIDAINFDLMYGLPGQELADVDTTIDEALALAPSRIADRKSTRLNSSH